MQIVIGHPMTLLNKNLKFKIYLQLATTFKFQSKQYKIIYSNLYYYNFTCNNTDYNLQHYL